MLIANMSPVQALDVTFAPLAKGRIRTRTRQYDALRNRHAVLECGLQCFVFLSIFIRRYLPQLQQQSMALLGKPLVQVATHAAQVVTAPLAAAYNKSQQPMIRFKGTATTATAPAVTTAPAAATAAASGSEGGDQDLYGLAERALESQQVSWVWLIAVVDAFLFT